VFATDPPPIPAETPAEAKRRHERVAERRKGTDIICHRGASEHAHENTLEAFRATFELGGDGNEFDIRATRDGVLVVFHDDMLDRHWRRTATWRLHLGGVAALPVPRPRPVRRAMPDPHAGRGLRPAPQTRRAHAPDIKRPGLDGAIGELLTRMDLWDHVGYCNAETGGAIPSDARFKPRRYKAGLYLDRGEVFPERHRGGAKEAR